MKAIIRLWKIATCNHRNRIIGIQFESSIELEICQSCGRVLSVMDDNDRRHNQHKKRWVA